MYLNESLKKDIVNNLRDIDPDKIILFGSYAQGTANPDSDIDLFIIKNIDEKNIRSMRIRARKQLREIIRKYKTGFDVFVDNEEKISERLNEFHDQFYEEIMNKGEVIYAK